jgi:hypothetical protein
MEYLKMNNNLNIGKYYTLKYRDNWKDFDILDVKVIALTTESESGQYGVDSLYSEFFSRYNISISSYVELINNTPEIYVCQAISSRDPIEIDDSTMILIPKLIIDFTKSEQLLLCDKISLTINGLIKYHELVYNRGDYLINLTKNIQKKIKNTEEYGDSPTTINYTTSDILKTESEYKKYEDFKNYTFNLEKLATDQEILKHNSDLKQMIEKSQELDTLLNNYNAKLSDLDDLITLYSESKENYDTTISNIRDSANTLFSGLENGDILVNSVDYFTYRNVIMNAINNS